MRPHPGEGNLDRLAKLISEPIQEIACELKRFGSDAEERRALRRIEEKLDRLTKAFTAMQEDKAKMQKLFDLVDAQQEKLKQLSA